MNLKAKLLQSVEAALTNTAEDFTKAQQQQFDEEVYSWPRITKRTNGEIASSPRDITDTGNLKESLQVNQTSRFSYNYWYPPDYAALVHEGGKTASGSVYPARPWIDDAIAILDIPVTFSNYLEDELS